MSAATRAESLATDELEVRFVHDLGRLPAALRQYERTLELDPEHGDALFNAAQIYEESGDKANAVRCLKRYRDLRSS